jgi:long-subunit acyl-CoA synthetase (AMP-forming)
MLLLFNYRQHVAEIRGNPVTRGYYDDEETAAACRPNGWFLTGDIGQVESNGMVDIIDHKKNIVKTLNGEYNALEKLESVYRATRYWQQQRTVQLSAAKHKEFDFF